MIREHAGAFLQESASLRIELAAVLGPVAASASGAAIPPPDGAGVSVTIKALLRLAKADDEAVRSAFAVQTRAPAPVFSLKSASFWDGVVRAESLARSLTDVR